VWKSENISAESAIHFGQQFESAANCVALSALVHMAISVPGAMPQADLK
jgi:hypothetical protein